MFNDEGKLLFDVKTEYNKPYFTTMQKIFPELSKENNFSFISEHMIIKQDLMSEIIDKIQNKENISGETWYEKVINCIDPEDLGDTGFSEFKTYGTFVQHHHKGTYDIRKWKSLRSGNSKYDFQNFSDEDAKEVAKNYYAISFEHF